MLYWKKKANYFAYRFQNLIKIEFYYNMYMYLENILFVSAKKKKKIVKVLNSKKDSPNQFLK